MPSGPPPLRRQQAEALAAISGAWRGGAHAAWVVLPPGGGKTRVGLESVALHPDPAVVLAPNTAVQSQWMAQAQSFGLRVGDRHDLASGISVLTYQSVALFTTDDDDVERVGAERRHIDRLHPNALDLVDRLAALGPLTLVLDECHHLLDVWGELLAEVLDRLPQARILALTATPPEALAADEAELVERLFGSIVYTASIPGFVRDGHLAPFRELVAFTVPTAGEAEYLSGTALRFAQMRSDLMTPDLTSVGFLAWLDERFVRRVAVGARSVEDTTAVSWQQVVKSAPDLADAALRAHHAGLMALPTGARIREQHRAAMDGDDWSLLIDDFIRGVLLDSTDPRDREVLERIREAVPGIGLRLTRHGLAKATSPVDRVVARSAGKAVATVEIADLEWGARGDGLRMLVLCDFERASPQVPEGLVGVIEPEEGSARGVLRRLTADPLTRGLQPVMVTGRSVACGRDTAPFLIGWLRDQDPGLDIRADDGDGCSEIVGTWDSRRWVPLLTRWFEDGRGRALIGTRALLGEGWDARRINVLVDLSSATTPMAVTQTRGRALRTDPQDPAKVAHTWTVVCIADGHPLGDRDYHRFVRKHHGFFSVTEDGLITDGVAHVHPDLTAFAPPSLEDRAIIAQDLRAAALDRDRTRELWQVGQPYADEPVADIRVRADRSLGLDLTALRPGSSVASIAQVAGGGQLRLRPGWSRALAQWLTGRTGADGDAAQTGTLAAFAAAVADGLRSAGHATEGSGQVRIAPTAAGSYRIWLQDVQEDVSRVFADALDEVLSPLGSPRYLVPRYTIPEPATPAEARRLAWRKMWHLPVPATVVWHAVPSSVAGHRAQADAFADAWNRWVSPGHAVFAGSPEGAGVLASQRGDDPFGIDTGMRVEWR